MRLGRSTRPPRLFAVVGIVVFLLAGGWSALWFVASSKTDAALVSWMDHETTVGRTWSCPERKTGGYPFGITISCQEPHFAGTAFGTQLDGKLAGFVATASVFSPQNIHAILTGPLILRAPDVETQIHWSHLALDVANVVTAPSHIAIHADDVAIDGHLADIGQVTGAAVSIQAEANAAQGLAETYAFHTTLTGLSQPALDALFSADPKAADAKASLDVSGVLTEANFGAGGTPPQQIERWREAGGRVDIANLHFTKGATKIDAHGSLKLDDAHRLQGKLDTGIAGIDALSQRLGINPSLLKAGSLLQNLLGHVATGTGPALLKLPVGFEAGGVVIGPVRTSLHLPPLY